MDSFDNVYAIYDYDKGDAPFTEETGPVYPLSTPEEDIAYDNRFKERFGKDFMKDLEEQLAKVIKPSLDDMANEFEKALLDAGIELKQPHKIEMPSVLTSANIQVSEIHDVVYNNEVPDIQWDCLKAAEHYYASGFCPIPCDEHKAPLAYGWSKFCHKDYATHKDHSIQETQFKDPTWFGSYRDKKQVGLVLGKASGNVGVIDVECESAFNDLISSTQGTSVGDIIERCPMARSPNGGAHIFLFFDADECVPPKEILAESEFIIPGKKSTTLIEFLGQGEQVVVSTDPIATETSRKHYMKGKRHWIHSLPKDSTKRHICSPKDIKDVFDACRKLSEVELKPKTHTKVDSGTTLRPTQRSASPDDVFATFNCSIGNQELALELILRDGWTIERTSGDKTHLKRANKDVGTSATWGCTNSSEYGYPYFYVFTTSTDWEAKRNYSPWDVVQKLKYNDNQETMLADLRVHSLRELVSKTQNNPEFAYETERAEATPVVSKVASGNDIDKFKSKVAKFKHADRKIANTTGAMSKLIVMGKQDYALDWDQFSIIIADWNTKTQSNWPLEAIRLLWDATEVNVEQLGSALHKVPNLKLKTKRLSDYQISPTNWVVKDRHGKGLLIAGLTLLVGQSGLGKSTFTRYLAASVTNGGADGKLIVDEGEVLFLCFEDSVEETILPHVICCGGNPDKVNILEGCVAEDGTETAWTATMMREVKEYLQANPSIKLVIVDVLTSLTAGTKASTNDADQTRAILEPLSKMGQEHGVAILALHHPNKHGTNARAAISGSNQLAATARLVWYLGKDEMEDDVRQVCKVKSNYHKVSDGIAFRHRQVPRSQVEFMADKYAKEIPDSIPDDEFHTVEIIDYKVLTADDLVRNTTEPVSTHDKCTKWLLTRLEGGQRELSAILEQECQDAGFTGITLKRVRKELSELREIETFREENKWYVRLLS